jgi:hypothetical protein
MLRQSLLDAAIMSESIGPGLTILTPASQQQRSSRKELHGRLEI